MFFLRNITFILFITLIPINAEANNKECKKAISELNNFINHSEDIYKNNPSYFWEFLNKTRDLAYSNNSTKNVSNFLRLVSIANPPAEFDEFLSDGIETLCIEKPLVLKKTMLALDTKLQKKLVKKLNAPLYYAREELKACR